MATTKIEITNIFAPDASGDVFSTLLSLVAPTTGLFGAPCWAITDTNNVKAELHGVFGIPEEFSSAPIFRVTWVSDIATGDVVLEGDISSVGDSGDLDPTVVVQSVTTTTTVDAQFEVNTTDMAFTVGNFTAADTCQVIISRDLSDAADTLVGDIYIVGIFFVYTTA